MSLEFDEDKAIEAIKAKLPENIEYDDDDILNVIDIIFDYYEDNDLLDIDSDIDDEEDKIKTDLINHVSKMLKKDPYTQIKPEHVRLIVCAELEYEQSLID